jgi:phosphoribosylformylglycinamidine synthase subunit PurQ / glutaminase
MKPRVLVFSGYGLNCEEETKYAFECAGAEGQIVHINDVIEKKFRLSDFQILAFGGGFAYGDDTGAGNAYANKLKNNLWDELLTFVKRDTLILGICNGFQILVNLGLLPALDLKYGTRELGLMHNDVPRYTVRFVDLQVCSRLSPWLSGIDTLAIPVSNGEGKLYATDETLLTMKQKNLIALRYTRGEMCKYQNLPASPNGSIDDIAGITDETGRILGLMPHPERSMFFTQLPNWGVLKEQYVREGKAIPMYGPGMQVFENAVRYFK